MMRRIGAWIKEWIIGDDLPPSTAHILPLIALGALALKAGSKIAKSVGQHKRAKEQAKADKAGFTARKTQFGQLQQRRGVKLEAVQRFLGNLQGSLAQGAPDYRFDPGTLADLQRPVDYAEAAPADVSKGSGWGVAGDVAGTVGESLGQIYMGGLMGGATGAGSAGMAPGGQYTPFKPSFGGAGSGLDLPPMTPDNPFGVRR